MGAGRSIGWASAVGAGLGLLVIGLVLPPGAVGQSGVNVTSQVEVRSFVAVAFASNLTDGIVFSNNTTDAANPVDPGHDNYNATDNINNGTCAADCRFQGNSSLWANASTDSNTIAKICIAANDSLRIPGSSTTIELANNYTYNFTKNLTKVGGFNASSPLGGGAFGGPFTVSTLSTSNATNDGCSNLDANDPASKICHMRFWLDVPPAQAAGTYFNRVALTVVPQSDTLC